MKTIVALEDFDGYPQGAKVGSKRHDFLKGDELEVPDAFAELVIGKGHAKEKAGEPKETAKQAATAKAEAKADAKAAATEEKE